MPSTTDFHLFTQLPIELRLMIWEFAILHHNRDRLVPINQETKRVICIVPIANPPHFYVSTESREVCQQLYPIRLPVFWKLGYNGDPQYGYRETDENMEDDLDRCKGHIHVSTQHDIFVFGIDRVGERWFREYWYTTGPVGGSKNFAKRSASLTQQQCLEIRRIMVFNQAFSDWLGDGCPKTLRCAVRCGALEHEAWYNDQDFPGVQECIYAPLGDDFWGEMVYLYSYMLHRPGHRVLTRLDRGNHLVLFDKEQIAEARVRSLVCVCNDDEIRERVLTW